MYISTRLIHCSSLSHCIYYKPSVNYHDSADSLDKINSIINCVENGENPRPLFQRVVYIPKDRSIFYFSTDTVVVQPNVISGKIATYHEITTKSNCSEVNDSYRQNYFMVGSIIYIINQGSIIEFSNVGYFFINSSENVIVSSKDIKNYNDIKC
ncbi:hypothetical protein H8356DRAFT_1072841 [Neocallimastix lanati (nom. inval.)]|nr:hypothetical protein H8356DRAFT_1072841 [Neocallimastix sp. JGI-2020a]